MFEKSHIVQHWLLYANVMSKISYSTYELGKHPCQINIVFGTNVRRLRREQRLSLVGLAHISGVSRQLLAKIELGDADVRLSYLKRLADAFCVDPQELLRELEY